MESLRAYPLGWCSGVTGRSPGSRFAEWGLPGALENSGLFTVLLLYHGEPFVIG